MKFYTSKWWSETSLEEGDDTNERYRAYINSVRSKLSAEILRLVETVSLHDAKVRNLALDSDQASLVIQLEGYDYHRLSQGKQPTGLNITIGYEGLSAFFVTGKPSPHSAWFKDGDLGYHEIEVLSRDKFEHRLLFDTGDEVTVRFRRLTIETVPKPNAANRKSNGTTQMSA